METVYSSDMLLALLAAVRVPNIVGESNYIPFLTEKADLEQFLANHTTSVIIYEPARYILEFVDYSVFKYSDRVGFAAATNTLAPEVCGMFPCFVGYSGGKRVPIEDPIWSSPGFALWCENVLRNGKFPLAFAEQLREQIARDRVCVFGVGIEERPSDVPENVPFYLADAKAFEGLSLNVSKGVWVYRPKDRQLVPYARNFSAVAVTPILTVKEEFLAKPFVGGYVLSTVDEELSNEHVAILLDLAAKYGEKFSFVLTNGEEFKETMKEAGMTKVKQPFFFVLDTSNITKDRRWFVYGEDANNGSYVEAFLNRVVAGQEEVSMICSELPEQGPENKFWELNARTIESVAINPETAVVITVTAPWCGHCKLYKPVLNVTAEINAVNNSNVKFYWIDATINQLPPIVPEYSGFPTTFMWPAGENYTKPVTFDGDRDVGEILKWVKENCGLPDYQMPTWDQEQLDARRKELTQYA